MKHIIYSVFLLIISSNTMQATTADELLQIHKVTNTEMNAIVSPEAGSLVYNSTANTLFFYTGTAWKKMRSIGSETILNAGSGIAVSGDGTGLTPYVVGVN